MLAYFTRPISTTASTYFKAGNSTDLTTFLESNPNQPNIQTGKNKKEIQNKTHFKALSNAQWLAGLIDGDGCFQLSKKGYASLEIIMSIRDEHCLNIIKNKYGGSIKLRSNTNALRYRLHHKAGLLELINDVNGLIRNPNRIIQLNKLCNHYNLIFIFPIKLTYNNG